MSDLQRALADELKDPEFRAAYIEADAKRRYQHLQDLMGWGTEGSAWDMIGDHVKDVYRREARQALEVLDA